MYHLVFLSLILKLCETNPQCGRKHYDPRQTIGGEVTSSPWAVSIGHHDNGDFEHVCTGAILSSTVVITAAHCFGSE